MSLEVLQSRTQYEDARALMRQRGIDCIDPLPKRILRKLGLLGGVNVGDARKSWDVYKTIQFIEAHVPLHAPVLDIGAYASEVLCSLHRLDYTALTGVDLNPKIIKMPYADSIRFSVHDFLHSPFPAATFSAVTAISVIEHGFDTKQLLREISRILRPGGFFIASVDYWPEKIDTRGINKFDLDWMIFSRGDLVSFLAEADKFGLKPFGPGNFDARDRVVSWQGKQYTFAWLALRKNEPGE
jgi:SAM-dependent methyltransferase